MRKRVIRFLVAALLLPLAGRLAVRGAEALERRHGPTLATRGMRAGGSLLRRR